MDQTTKAKLKKIPKTICAKCKSKRSYGNPMAKCDECGARFCFDHIWGGQIKKDMSKNESVRDICDFCKERGDYRNL